MTINKGIFASAIALLCIAIGPAANAQQQQTTVHRQTTTTHTEHHEGPAPIKVTVQHRTVHHTRRPVAHHTATAHHTTTVKKTQTQTNSTSTTVEQH